MTGHDADRPFQAPTTVEIREEPVTALDEYATVPIAFEVRSV